MNFLDYINFLDARVQEIILNLRVSTWDNLFFIITKIGSWPIIFLLLIFLYIIFYIRNEKDFIVPFVISVLSSGIMTLIIKFLVDRPRPGVDISLYTERLASFPSAHSALTFAFFGLLIYFIWKVKMNLIAKILFGLLFIAIIILVGISRIYLGVHFTTDVLGGYLVGLLGILFAIYITRNRAFMTQ
jgi:undecaprenyl-diphosphatase